jgi:hypothetical protein
VHTTTIPSAVIETSGRLKWCNAEMAAIAHASIKFPSSSTMLIVTLMAQTFSPATMHSASVSIAPDSLKPLSTTRIVSTACAEGLKYQVVSFSNEQKTPAERTVPIRMLGTPWEKIQYQNGKIPLSVGPGME